MKTPHGFALPTLMVMLALASLAALLALRNLWVNEQLINAEADQLRTLHRAHATLSVTVADIVGVAHGDGTTPDLRHTAGNAVQTHAFFPASMTEYDTLRQRLLPNVCNAGICAPHALSANATQASYWKTQTATAMTVAAVDGSGDSGTAWYWVEVFPQDNTPHDQFIYRITVLAKGLMPGSTTVLQAIWERNAPTSPTGQWHSWHVLHD
jgi:Tfp pilus assembly protein PilX